MTNRKQAPISNVSPSDAEIIALSEDTAGMDSSDEAFVCFARGLLAKYGATVTAQEPVAEIRGEERMPYVAALDAIKNYPIGTKLCAIAPQPSTSTPVAAQEPVRQDSEKIIDASPRDLMSIAHAVPQHLRLRGWFVGRPAFGVQYVYADDFMGKGRQSLFSMHAGKLFPGIAEFVARFDPPTVAQLLYRMTSAETAAIHYEQSSRHTVGLRQALRKALATAGHTEKEIDERMAEFSTDASAWSRRGDQPMSETGLAFVATPPADGRTQEPLHITHAPLIRNAISLLRLRMAGTPDVEQVVADLEKALDGMPTPAGEPSQQWLDVAAQPQQDADKVDAQAIPGGYALIPLRPNSEMKRLMQEENWQWPDLLAAANAITEKQYNELSAAQPDQAMAAWEEISDAEIESAVRRVTGDHTGEYTQNDRDFYGELTRELVKRVQPANGEDARDVEIARLNAIINTPQSGDFLRAVSIEAEHQRQRWGASGDAGKTPADWFWLVGYLAGKSLHAHSAADTEKAEHHIITTAAACQNWHAAMFGKTDMRPDADAARATKEN